MYQVGRATRHRAARSAESVKWLVPKFWQKKEEKEIRKRKGDRGSSLDIGALKLMFSALSDLTSSTMVCLSKNIK